MKNYELTMTNGSNTIAMIVKDFTFEANGAAIRATKIGTLAGFNDDGSFIYQPCKPCEVIVGGGHYVLTEYHEMLA